MRFDFDALERMQAVLGGQADLAEALAHPAYQAVMAHARRFSDGISPEEVAAALRGEPSPFYGMRDARENMARIRELADTLRQNQQAWLDCAAEEYARLLPGEDLEPIRIYPILGYDKGIGLNEAVCMNLNCQAYLDRPVEFLYYLIHETAHVLYERHQHVPALAEVQTPADWAGYFSLWTQNEGFAVYSALRLRQAAGHLGDPDYQVLSDPACLRASLDGFVRVYARFQAPQSLPLEDYLEGAFGDQRLTYRAGCQIFSQIEQGGGLPAVRRAWLAQPGSFLTQYAHFAAAD